MPTQSWFPSSLLGSSNSSRPATPTSSSSMSAYRASESPSTGLPSPAEAAGVIARLKDKSVDELRKLLTDKSAYEAFFNSLEQVKDQNNLRRELWEETLQLARENSEKETHISELRNQCRIIRTTELAAAQEKLKELEKQKDGILSFYSPLSMLQNLQDAMNKKEEESEILHNKLLEKDVDLATFLQKYKMWGRESIKVPICSTYFPTQEASQHLPQKSPYPSCCQDLNYVRIATCFHSMYMSLLMICLL